MAEKRRDRGREVVVSRGASSLLGGIGGYVHTFSRRFDLRGASLTTHPSPPSGPTPPSLSPDPPSPAIGSVGIEVMDEREGEGAGERPRTLEMHFSVGRVAVAVRARTPYFGCNTDLKGMGWKGGKSQTRSIRRSSTWWIQRSTSGRSRGQGAGG